MEQKVHIIYNVGVEIRSYIQSYKQYDTFHIVYTHLVVGHYPNCYTIRNIN